MALRLMESFDLLDETAFRAKYSMFYNARIATGRNGQGAHLDWPAFLWTITFDAQPTWIVGRAFKCASASSSDENIFRVKNGGTELCTFNWNKTTGAIYMKVGSTVVMTTAAGMVPVNTWHYVECKVTLSDTNGSATIQIDGVPVVTVSGVATSASGSTGDVIQFAWLGDGGNVMDDLYILDGTGSRLNDFLGDVSVTAHAVSAAGSSTVWTPVPSAPNYARVQGTPDGDTTGVTSANIGDKDLYAAPVIPGFVDTIHAVSMSHWMKKDDAGSRAVQTILKSNGVEQPSVSQPLGSTYQIYERLFAVNPTTGLPWTAADFFAAEFGQIVSA